VEIGPDTYNHLDLPPSTNRFGPVHVDRVTYRVPGAGQPLDLTPKLLDLLLHLLDHGGELVKKVAAEPAVGAVS
jgi:DNA-binding response OmpR family regulator